MRIQIYYNNSKSFIPFEIYVGSIQYIIKNNEYFVERKYEVELINDLIFVNQKTDYLILFIREVNELFNINTYNIKIILINADNIYNFEIADYNFIYQYFNFHNYQNCYIWDYNKLNIEYYNNYFYNNKIFYIPLIYNKYLEELYNTYTHNQINYENKPFNICILGSMCMNERRHLMLQKINNNKEDCINIFSVDKIEEFIYWINNCKIILNVYTKEFNKPFDYYRFSLLLSNKILCITEEYIDDDEINYLKDFMIQTNYDNLDKLALEYINKSNEEINEITNKLYQLFKQKTMDDYLINFFNNVN